MAMQDDPLRNGGAGPRQEAGVGRLANTSENPEDTSVIPGVEKPIARPAQAVAEDDMDASPPTEDGGEDRARIVPPPNQGESTEVTRHIVGGEAGDTVY